MMWFTKSIGLVALLVSGLCNAGELEREESNVRMDAEKDPFENLMFDDANGPTSQLFGNCLAAARTLQAKIYSIELPRSSKKSHLPEYVRHVPDSYELLVPAGWESITTNAVSSILECATAAYKNGYPMFKYNGVNDCKVATRAYDLTYAPACETTEREAVFILSRAMSACPLPAVIHNWNDETSLSYTTCIFITTDSMTMSEADAWCASKNAGVFAESAKITYSEIVQILKGLNVSTHDFFTKAKRQTPGPWRWPTASPVDPALMVGNSTSSDDVMYMKGSAGFKFDFGLASSFKAGVVCVEEPEPGAKRLTAMTPN